MSLPRAADEEKLGKNVIARLAGFFHVFLWPQGKGDPPMPPGTVYVGKTFQGVYKNVENSEMEIKWKERETRKSPPRYLRER